MGAVTTLRRSGVLAGLWACALFAGCSGPRTAAPSELPPGSGLVTADRTPPAGAETHAAPEWRAGDRFVYRKAGRTRLALRALADADDGPRMLDEGSGRLLRIGPDQLQRGQLDPEGAVEFALDPGDDLVAWPLWVGKRWSSEFVSRAPGRPDLPMVATYLCDGRERLTVPAGEFDCLRIWRRLRVATEGDFPERVALFWYAPEAGNFVRRLEDGLLTELVELHRQR